MKVTNKFLMFASASLMLASCDLDKLPEGQYVSDSQKEDVINARPNLIVAEVNAMAAQLNMFGTISTDASTYHSDYGVPAIAQIIDQSGMDMPVSTSGYNWFRRAQNFGDRVYDSSDDELIWKIFYNHMKAANNVLTLTESSDDESLKVYRGQAYAARAYDYINLAQLYQFTYAGHESMLCVPIVTETKSDEELQNNPRATVKEVYDQIMSDLNNAIELLGSYDNGSNKDQIDIYVAYGLRARANLLMQNWSAAASDAAKAIEGGTPQSIADVSTPTFNSADASSWLWGVMVSEDNDVVTTGIINWPSHLCSLTGNGYTTLVGTFRFGSSKLYDMIPDTDIRKQWFLSPEGTSTLVSEETVQSFGLEPYVNVKFGAYQGIVGNSTNASDWPLMRVEEMYLIKAEAEAMAGNLAQGKATLNDFVSTYRDPSFQSKATTAEELQDEVWLQRRVELWGEGFSLFDILRLKKAIDRKDSNYSAIVQFYIQPEDQIMIFRIPQCEMESNKGITEDQNNPAGAQPTV